MFNGAAKMQDTTTETELLRASLAGGKDAFGRIVERYQPLICAITYSATGDFGRSRQLAQETFIRAYKSLAQLKDLEKFRAYLCRIARNLVDKSIRQQRFDVIRDAHPLEDAASGKSPEPDPSEIAISKEHQALVWRAIEGIPEQCREPIVLYYRRRRSIAQVAADLKLSDDAVKQRILRGRKLLSTEIASLVEDVLTKTAPGKAFTVAVVASLPALAPQTTAAGIAAPAATGPTPLSKGAIYGAFAGGIFGGVAWILPTSFMAKDWPAAAIVFAAATLIFVVSTTLCLRDQRRRWRILVWAMIALCALNLAVVNTRWNLWKQALKQAPGFTPPTSLSRWTINLAIAAIAAALLLICLHLNSRQRKQTAEMRPQSF
jgi:RNA polymerase sigma factor (sigma-70 family)